MNQAAALTIDRREALAITKALAALSVQSRADNDLTRFAARLDRFLVGTSVHSRRSSVVSSSTLHGLVPVQSGVAGRTRYTFEFEMDGSLTNALVDGEITVKNVIALTREPGIIRVHVQGGHDVDFVVPVKLPADWVAALPPGRRIRVSRGSGERR